MTTLMIWDIVIGIDHFGPIVVKRATSKTRFYLHTDWNNTLDRDVCICMCMCVQKNRCNQKSTDGWLIYCLAFSRSLSIPIPTKSQQRDHILCIPAIALPLSYIDLVPTLRLEAVITRRELQFSTCVNTWNFEPSHNSRPIPLSFLSNMCSSRWYDDDSVNIHHVWAALLELGHLGRNYHRVLDMAYEQHRGTRDFGGQDGRDAEPAFRGRGKRKSYAVYIGSSISWPISGAITDYGSTLVHFMRNRQPRYKNSYLGEAERPSPSYIIDVRITI